MKGLSEMKEMRKKRLFYKSKCPKIKRVWLRCDVCGDSEDVTVTWVSRHVQGVDIDAPFDFGLQWVGFCRKCGSQVIMTERWIKGENLPSPEGLSEEEIKTVQEFAFNPYKNGLVITDVEANGRALKAMNVLKKESDEAKKAMILSFVGACESDEKFMAAVSRLYDLREFEAGDK